MNIRNNMFPNTRRPYWPGRSLRSIALSSILILPGISPMAQTESDAYRSGEWLDASLRLNKGDRSSPQPAPQPEPAQEPGSKPETDKPRDCCGGVPWRQWSQMSGDWGGMRTRLKDLGFDAGGDYTLDASGALSGGVRQQVAARGLLSAHMTWDPKPLLGWDGGTLFAQYIYRHGPNVSKDIGDIQGYDNMDADRLSKAEEIWYEQHLLNEHLRIKTGQVDANAEFDYIESASEFLNSSAGYSPTILDMPTYPQPRLSMNVFAYAATNYYIGGGVYVESIEDGAGFENPIILFETGATKPASDKWGAGRVALGGWHSMAQYNRCDGNTQDGASGFYALVEQQLWRENAKDAQGAQGLAGFAQYGYGDKTVGDIAHHFGFGLRYAGLIPGRDADSTGLYYSRALLSRANGSPYRHNESALECYYRFQMTGCLCLQPDLQWIDNPGGAQGDALVATLRMKVDF